MVLGLSDLLDNDLVYELSQKVYRANIYNGDFDMAYSFDNGSLTLTCSTGASGTGIEL